MAGPPGFLVALRAPRPLRLKPSGEFLKTAHWAVFLTEFHLIGSNPGGTKHAQLQPLRTYMIFVVEKMAGPPGFEPGLRAPKTPVLPLHHGPVRKRRAKPVLEKSVVGREGIEPAALGLKVPCSTS